MINWNFDSKNPESLVSEAVSTKKGTAVFFIAKDMNDPMWVTVDILYKEANMEVPVAIYFRNVTKAMLFVGDMNKARRIAESYYEEA